MEMFVDLLSVTRGWEGWGLLMHVRVGVCKKGMCVFDG